MGIIERIKRRLWASEDPRKPIVIDEDTIFPPLNAASKLVAIQSSTVWRCVSLISGTIASLPCHVYERGRDARRRAEEHPAFYLLHDAPSPKCTPYSFFEFLMVCLLLDGNAYAMVRWRRDGYPAELVLVPPSAVSIEPNGGTITYTVQSDFGHIRVPASSMVHVPGLGFDGLKGLSVISAVARSTVGLSLSLQQVVESMTLRGIRPSGVVEVDAALSVEAMRRLRQQFESMHSGPNAAGKAIFLDKGMTWKPVQISPVDAQVLETRRFQVADICRIFGVPPHMVGETDKTTSWGSGIEQQTIGFVRYTIRPWLIRIEQEITRKLLRPPYYCQFSLEGLLRGDSEARSRYYSTALQNGWLSPNEIRALEDLPPVDGGDQLFRPANLSPLNGMGVDNGDSDE